MKGEMATVFVALALLLPPTYTGQFANGAAPECSSKCVAFRLDDVQDYYYSAEQRKFIEMFMASNASLTIGVIAGSFGNDTDLLNVIGQYRNDSKLEIAIHGWLHEDFGQFAEPAVQKELLDRANSRIRETLGNDVAPTTFIAPFDNINNQTYRAVLDSGLYIISADTNTDAIFAGNQTAGSQLYHLPMTSEASVYNTNTSLWERPTAFEILADIRGSIEKYGIAVVMIHPTDSLTTIQSVVSHIQGATDYKIVTLAQMAFGENKVPEGLNVALLAASLAGSYVAIKMYRKKMSG